MRVARRLLIVCAIAAAGCTSPESKRTRGGGPGADVGNRPEAVKMHEGSRPYWNTPGRIAVEAPPLDSAQQARQMSRP
jgi:hypothetical protein